MAFRGSAREERRVPDATENAETGGARDEEAEAIERMAEVAFAIAERNDGDGGVIDGVQR